MVGKGDIDIAAARDEVAKALTEFNVNDSSTRIWIDVMHTDVDNLIAVVADRGFAGMSMVQRQKLVWDYLREAVSAESLSHVGAVYTIDSVGSDSGAVDVNAD